MASRHTLLLTKNKIKSTFSSRKIMCTVFWNKKGFYLWTSYLNAPQSNLISTVKHLWNCIMWSRISGMGWLPGASFISNCCWLITTATHTLPLQSNIYSEPSEHLVLNNLIICHTTRSWTKQMSPLQCFLGGQWLHNGDDAKQSVTMWFKSKAGNLYNKSIQCLVPRYVMGQNLHKNYCIIL